MEYFLADLLQAFEGNGTQAAALVHNHRKPLCGDWPLDLHRVPVIFRAPCYGRVLYAPISLSFPLWLARAIHTFKPDLLHLHMPNTSAFWALLTPAARRLPWIVHWHSDVVSSRIDRRLALAYRVYRPWERRLLAASRAIIVTSPNYLEASEALQPWREKCRVIPLGFDPARIAEPALEAVAQAQSMWGETSCRLLAVGRLTYYKGFEVLIRAVADITAIRLVIVGQGEHHRRLAALIETLGLSDRVVLAGFRTEAELNALWASCDIFCLPSLERTEAFGLVLLEAMRFQKPVIASDIPGSGVGWVIRQGQHGVLVRPNDANALAKAIGELCRQPQRRRQLGQAGALALQRVFHIKRIAAQTASLYREIENAKHEIG
jgi:glycosyltransferase involved in cell wall biosynthesis